MVRERMNGAWFQKSANKANIMMVIVISMSFIISSCHPSTSNISEIITPLDNPGILQDGDSPPEISSTGNDLPAPNVWVDDDFIISYDDDGLQDASAPVIAVSPSVPSNPVWGNSVHAAWTEWDEVEELDTIHYSMSLPEERGQQWSNDEASEGDRTISGLFDGKNASNPSMIIDDMGHIHIVWCQEYFETGMISSNYEVHYSQSMDNGQTWSPEVLVSKWNHGGLDAPMEFFPKIEVSNDYMGQKILHVIWSEYTPDWMHSEMFYSTSTDGGISWSGVNENNTIRADLAVSAYDPDITVSGPIDEYVHISWSQESPNSGTSEIYYTRSTDAGTGGTWDQEKVISNDLTGPENLWVGIPKIATTGNSVFTIWDQPLTTDGKNEICISFSNDNGTDDWSSIDTDNVISFEDDSAADWGSLDLITDPTGAAYAIWTEYDENSPDGSTEIHFSMSQTPDVPATWTGRQDDIILSYPDGEDGIAADAMYPSVDIANFGGGWTPQIIWSELNAQGGGTRGLQNTEIHYIPDMTFDIPVHLGWNLISVPLIQDITTVATVLDDSQGDGNTLWNRVKHYNNTDSNNPWSSYSSTSPGLSGLSYINHKIGIWVHITSLGDGYLTVYGDYGTSTTMDLNVGWNLVGYPAQTDKTVAQALVGISYDRVEGYSPTAPYVQVLLGTDTMTPGEGYWIHVTASDTWTVDW